jgi:hypothetical protein
VRQYRLIYPGLKRRARIYSACAAYLSARHSLQYWLALPRAVLSPASTPVAASAAAASRQQLLQLSETDFSYSCELLSLLLELWLFYSWPNKLDVACYSDTKQEAAACMLYYSFVLKGRCVCAYVHARELIFYNCTNSPTHTHTREANAK